MRHELYRTLIFLPLLAPGEARAAEALVVLSEPLQAHQRSALEGFRAEWPGRLVTASAGRPLPPGPHDVIVAFGGRAALRARSAGAPMVVALAPGYRDAGRPSVRVEMTPSPERIVRVLADAGVRRLLAVRATPAEPEFQRRASAAGASAGVRIEDRTLASPGGLPALLRRAGDGADAIWLTPDPDAVTPETFGAVREFARARSIPFFAPAAGLVSDEIRGELTASFEDCGRAAARAAREMLAGESKAKVVYPDPGG